MSVQTATDEPEVTKTIFTQYQAVHTESDCDATDYDCIKRVAWEVGFEELHDYLIEGDFRKLLRNYREYREEFTDE